MLQEGATNYLVSRRLADGRLTSFRGFVFSTANVDDLAKRVGRRGFRVSARSIGGHAGRIWQFGSDGLTVGDIATGIGADLIIGGLWQGVSDTINHPGLWTDDPFLAGRRIGAASVANATNGVIGGTIGTGLTLLGFAAFEATPIGWVVTIGGIVGAVTWDTLPPDQYITNYIFDKFDANIGRNLQALTP